MWQTSRLQPPFPPLLPTAVRDPLLMFVHFTLKEITSQVALITEDMAVTDERRGMDLTRPSILITG